MLTATEIQQRITMVIALAAENNPDDLEDLPPDLITLIGDLGTEDLRWLALYLARAAAIFYLPPEYREHPEALPAVAETLREVAFDFAVKEAAGE